jgi:Flp pilus assembly CpaE family ATPase
MLVTTNELAALQATRRSLRYLDAGAGDHAKLRLILNRHTPVTGFKREEVNTALAMQPFAILGNDYAVIQAALLDGRPVPPDSRFGESVQALCRQLSHKSAPVKKDGSWLGSLLKRKLVVSR